LTIENLYKQWSTDKYFDDSTKSELLLISDDEKEIRDRFYTELEFGTAGIRGIIGAGINRINVFVVRRVTQGIADLIKGKGQQEMDKGVVIAYDCRVCSVEFAQEAAAVFAGNGIKVYLHRELRPVPVLSFSVRYLKTSAGVMITASHNPKEYNGYKAYGEDGAQLSLEDSETVLQTIKNIEDYTTLQAYNFQEQLSEGKIEILDERVDKAYFTEIKKLIVDSENLEKRASKFKLVYTPLHGTGGKLVPILLKQIGFNKLQVVPEQMEPDGMFPTVRVPNPEEKDCYTLAIKLAEQSGADLILATDPDSDRTGVAVRIPNGDYVILNGNQIGTILLEFVLSLKNSNNSMPQNPFVVSTIVSTRLTEAICRKHGITYVDVLTGFKFIGEQIKIREEEGNEKFIFGFEESYGYLAGSYARDKDAVASCMLLAEAAAYHASRGFTLLDAVQEIYEKYGFYKEEQVSLSLKGEAGINKIKSTMIQLKEIGREIFNNINVEVLKDFSTAIVTDYTNNSTYSTGLPKSSVLHYTIANGWFCIRPSGTEPKLKVYFGIVSPDEASAKEQINDLKYKVMSILNEMLEI